MQRNIALSFMTIGLLGSLILLSCRNTPPDVAPLPEGMQTLTGILLPAEISAIRRGTHIVKFEDKNLAYVESSKVNLRSFEGKEVRLTGTFEYNTEKTDLPVLVATSVETVAQETKNLSLPSFEMTATIPAEWTVETEASIVRIQTDLVNQDILTIKTTKDLILPSQGSPFSLSGQRAVKIKSPQGETVTVIAGNRSLVFTWSPPADGRAEFDAQWYAFLDSVKFSSQSSSNVSVATGTGSGTPCGGTAGILCPTGQYCAITDKVNNIGKCKSVK